MKRVLVANRGAIARRIVRACHACGLEAVAVYSEADAGAPHLDEADGSFALDGVTAADTYLNQAALLAIAERSGADAVHPGYGFLAENAGFAQAVMDAGLVFVGPSPRWLADMGDKVAARRLFAEHGFPVFAGSERLADGDAAQAAASAIGYPVMVKPSGGGGGLGMQVARNETELAAAFGRAVAIAESAFGDAGVYLEKFIEAPRHIEFQLLADGERAVHVFERECSVQRRNQKLIEEAPAPGLDAALVARHAALAAEVCTGLGYDNAGTLETLFTADGAVGFLEMNTRIQVEHAVTEELTGLDLVGWQLKLAAGESLPAGFAPEPCGHAIEARVYAEDPVTLLPSTGKLTRFHMPDLHGVRFETGYQEGQTVTPHYDALLAKLVARGTTRAQAIGRLLVALKAFEVHGVRTNQALLLRVLADADFVAGRVDTGLIPRLLGGTG